MDSLSIPSVASSSSTSTIEKTSFKYDVFLSFRGEDTRTNFVDHLYHALKLESIETYKDDENLERGKKISKELIQAIEDSRCHVIVFSKNYASSSWCLDELVKIMECQKTTVEHTVYPIFYHVEPTEVRKQSGEFGKAFTKHEKAEAAQKWREALIEATSFSGQELTVDRHEVEFIKTVVKEISLKLPFISGDENLVGMRTRINGVVSSLNAFPDEFCMIGIWGMGGGGKTTLARAVFDHISFQFEGTSFVANVREVSKPDFSGLRKLQRQVLRDVLNDQGVIIDNVFDGKNMMKKKMQGRKILVVLDDVDHINQLKALAGEPNWFKAGSKIIITTRDKQVLVAHKVNLIRDVNLLTKKEAICLLSRCAFGTENPTSGFKELSQKVVSYAAGLPLTITVLGSSLCDANEHVWIDTLERLEKIPLEETLQKLELSFMGLDIDCKEIFLDVACILKGWKEDKAIRALESCGFHVIRGLSVLQKRSLITISEDGYLGMHDHIQEMGRYIVRRLHPNEPNKHSRLWIKEEIKDILANNQGTEATTCVGLQHVPEMNYETIAKGLGKMEKLRFLYLKFHGIYSYSELGEVSQYFPNSLQYLNCFLYPFRYLPKTFQASNLVGLDMRHSQMDELWEGGEKKVLYKLRFLQLNDSNLRTFDLGLTPNLEILDLECCYDLVELHMHVRCPKLVSVKLNFSKLSTLDFRLAPNIKTLNLEGCQDLVKLDMPCECPQLKSLNLSSSKLRCLNLGLTSNIETLNLNGCADLVEFYMHCECPQLKSLNFSCPNLMSLNLGPTPNIETLKLEECNYCVSHTETRFQENNPVTLDMFHNNIKQLWEEGKTKVLNKLRFLDLSYSMLMTFDLGMAPNLETLCLENCENLVEIRIPIECLKLTSLRVTSPQLRTLDLRLTPNLETLFVRQSNDFVELLMPVDCCLKLKHLFLWGVKWMTPDLRWTPNLETLKLLDCVDLVELHMPVECPKLISLELDHSKLRTFDLGRIPNLEKLSLVRCHDLVQLQMPIEYLNLISLNLSYSKLRTIDLGLTPNLRSLYLKDCYQLVELGVPVGGLTNLESLGLSGCFGFTDLTFSAEELKCEFRYLDLTFTAQFHGISLLYSKFIFPKLQFSCFFEEHASSSDIGNLKNNSICFRACTNIMSLSQRSCGLQSVRYLRLKGSLQVAPNDLDRFECLEMLTLKLTKIKHLPDNICMLKHLKLFRLDNCKLLEKLPDDLDQLECLENLTLLECTSLRDIPSNICKMKHLKYLDLFKCRLVEKLPKELGYIESLVELNIKGTGISQLPLSIVLLEGLLIEGSTLLHQSCISSFNSIYDTFYHRGIHSKSLLRDPRY